MKLISVLLAITLTAFISQAYEINGYNEHFKDVAVITNGVSIKKEVLCFVYIKPIYIHKEIKIGTNIFFGSYVYEKTNIPAAVLSHITFMQGTNTVKIGVLKANKNLPDKINGFEKAGDFYFKEEVYPE